MENQPCFSLFDLLLSLSKITDSIAPALASHHQRTAYIAYRLSLHFGVPEERIQHLVIAAALHDIGAFSLAEKLRLLEFEANNPHKHAELGYLLLQNFHPIGPSARIVLYHHEQWQDRDSTPYKEIPVESYILHLADRIAVLIKPGKDILSQARTIEKSIAAKSGSMFMPEAVDAFMQLTGHEDFWLDALYNPLETTLNLAIPPTGMTFTSNHLEEMENLFRRLIDFRTHFTATHSSGVSACADTLSGIAGFEADDRQAMRLAGCLHDLGKLAVPSEILEKNAPLNREESFIMRSHTYHTNRMLEPLASLNNVRQWAALHHERLDGSGYPFHYSEENIPLGSRIMAVADVFTALTEDRPYRKGLEPDEVKTILKRMVETSALDGKLVDLLNTHFTTINDVRREAQSKALLEFKNFLQTSLRQYRPEALAACQ